MAFSKLKGQLGLVNARHLAYRATFNPSQTLINELADMDVDKAVNRLLNYGFKDQKINGKTHSVYQFTDYPLDLYNGKYFVPSYHNPYDSKKFMDFYAKRYKFYNYDNSIYAWWLREAQQCEGAQFKIAFYLHIQFVASLKIGDRFATRNVFSSFDFLDLINFFTNKSVRELAKRLVISDTMTRAYGNHNNQNGKIDENLGRELIELFTVQSDKGNETFDSKMDVSSASRVLSGYNTNTMAKNMRAMIQKRKDTMDPLTGIPLTPFSTDRHDKGVKQFSKYFYHKTIKGQTSVEGGVSEKDQLIDILYAHPNTAKAYANNLFHYFVSIDVNDSEDKNIISSLEKSLLNNDFNLHNVLFDLFTSKDFYDLIGTNLREKSISNQGYHYIGGKIKSPFEYIMIMLNQLKINPPKTTVGNKRSAGSLHKFYLDGVRRFCSASAMNLFEVGITGYQYSFRKENYDKSWITTNAVLERRSYVERLIRNSIKDVQFNAKKFVDSTFENPQNAQELMTQMINHFFVRPAKPNSKEFNEFKAIMLGDLSDKNWEVFYTEDVKGINIQLEDILIYILNSSQYLLL